MVPLAAFLTKEDGASAWKKPVSGQLKINVDVALFPTRNCFSFVCLARDHNGQFVEAISSCRDGILSPELAEAVGVREAIGWIKRHN